MTLFNQIRSYFYTHAVTFQRDEFEPEGLSVGGRTYLWKCLKPECSPFPAQPYINIRLI